MVNSCCFSYNSCVKETRLAAIDIGTNTFRLLIAGVHFNTAKGTYSIKELFSERIITRLGAGLSRNGVLKKKAISESLPVLKKFASILSQYHIYKTSAVATSVLREAKNSREFLDKVKDSAGIHIKIISGKEEAKITASGMQIGIKMPESALMIDIGGGSTELIFAVHGKPVLVRSLNLGVVYLAGKYMRKDPPSIRDLSRMNAEITQKIRQASGPFRRRLNDKSLFFGTAGTVTSLAAITKRLKKFEHKRIHGSRISWNKVRNIYSSIAFITSKERGRFIPFELSRLDIIVPGTLILLRLMEVFGFREIIVSNYGLREGLLVDLYKKLQAASAGAGK
jgi:exopolyphosphatase/guanosine-5'-triphosphate,3'-diphosphate pyrophosphatase